MSVLVYDEFVDEVARGWKIDKSFQRSEALPSSTISARYPGSGLAHWLPKSSVPPGQGQGPAALPSCSLLKVNFDAIPEALPTRQSLLLKHIAAKASPDDAKKATFAPSTHVQTVEVVTMGGFDSAYTMSTPMAYRWVDGGAARKSVEKRDEQQQRTLGIARVASPNEFGPKAQSFQPVGRLLEDARRAASPGVNMDRTLSTRSDLTSLSGPVRSRSPIGSASMQQRKEKPPIPSRRPVVKPQAFSYMNPMASAGYEKAPSGPNPSLPGKATISQFEQRVAEISNLQADTVRWERRTAYKLRRESRAAAMPKSRRDYA